VGCVWPSSVNEALSGAPLWALWKNAPTSDCAAEATIFLMTAATSVKCVLPGGFVAQEKQTPETAPCVGDREVRGIAMDVQYHVGSCGCRRDVRMRFNVISACGKSLSHKCIGKEGTTEERPATKCSLKVLVARSAALR
jgi:hypothetical protein